MNTITIETITPAMAQRYLANMDNPRKLRPVVAQRYAADMAAGRWEVGTSSLKFDVHGRLRDGQHRLQACIIAGVSFTTEVSRNLSEAAINNVDRGLVRQFADILTGRGYTQATALQATIVLGWRWDEGFLLRNVRFPTISQCDDWLGEHPTLPDRVLDAYRWRSKIGGRQSAAAAFLERIHTIDPVRAHEFGESVVSGAHLAEDDPIRRLRDGILRTSHARGRGQQTHDLALMCKAWNLWITGQSCKLLAWRRGPSLQEQFPNLVGERGQLWPFPDVVRENER